MRGYAKVLGVGLVVLVGAGVAVFLVRGREASRFETPPEVLRERDELYAKARELGLLVDVADLPKGDDRPDNVAPLTLKFRWESQKRWEHAFESGSREECRKALAELEPTLAEAARIADGRFAPIRSYDEFDDFLWPEIAQVKRLCRYFSLRARLNARLGRTDAAGHDIVRATRIAEFPASLPFGVPLEVVLSMRKTWLLAASDVVVQTGDRRLAASFAGMAKALPPLDFRRTLGPHVAEFRVVGPTLVPDAYDSWHEPNEANAAARVLFGNYPPIETSDRQVTLAIEALALRRSIFLMENWEDWTKADAATLQDFFPLSKDKFHPLLLLRALEFYSQLSDDDGHRRLPRLNAATLYIQRCGVLGLLAAAEWRSGPPPDVAGLAKRHGVSMEDPLSPGDTIRVNTSSDGELVLGTASMLLLDGWESPRFVIRPPRQ